jgi:pimeloyl-ACP methyl ester carboxylesterase
MIWVAVLFVPAVGLILAGVLFQRFSALRDMRRYCRDGRLIDVGGTQRFYLLAKGVNDPTVLFESGIGATSLNWCRIQEAISCFAATISYDRAGLGWSGPCSCARTPSNAATELHALLHAAGVKPPYVLVGHSFGGLVMRRFALLYPEEVAGVVLLDPMRCEEWPPLNAARQAVVDRGARLTGYAVWIARVGLARLAVTSLLCRSGRMSRWLTEVGGDGAQHVMGRVGDEIGKVPREVWPVMAAHWSRPGFYVGLRAHLIAIPETVREMTTAGPIREIPVAVLTPDKSTPLSDESLRGIGDDVRQVIVPGSAHWVHLDQPECVIEAIRTMVEAAKVAASPPQTVSTAI